jgi:ABC-type Fe3+ transport system substrate-binding protein
MRASLAVAITAAAALLGLPGPAAAAANWDEIVAAASKEGEVDVHGGPGKLYEETLTQGFQRAYPQIRINFSGFSGRDAIPKIAREREAGLYNWDVYVGGTQSVLTGLKPIGALAPLKPALVLPEVLDDEAWYGGLYSEWMDKEKTYVLGFEASSVPSVFVNWEFVSHDDLKTYQDLLKPQFADKIVWDDPRLPGQGGASGERMLINYGEVFLQRLYTGQKIAFIANPRQLADWLVRGRYPIGIGAAIESLEPFRQQGLGKNIAPLDVSLPHPTIAPGYGTVSLMDHAPHPNAATVYINWLLSKAGQSDWARFGHNSRRLDVPKGEPDYFPKAGVAYISEQSEEYMDLREKANAIAKQFIPAEP